MSDPPPHWPSNTVLRVLLALAIVGLAIDIRDGYGPKTFSSVFIVVGLVALMFARRYNSSRWRIAMLIAFTLAVTAMVARLAAWQGWV